MGQTARVKTSLGIWALGPMITRFVPGGYQPDKAGDDTVRKVRRAVEGLDGLIDDDVAFAAPWGFELGDVEVPVHMWYGEADRNVPIEAVQKMASQLPVESFEIIPGAGHLGWLMQEEQVLRALLEATS